MSNAFSSLSKTSFFELGFFFYLFDEIIVDNRFSDKFKAFFLPKHHMYLDTYYPYYKYINSENAKLFSCLYYEARRSSEQVLTTFLSILVRIYINNVMLISDELEDYPGITENQLNFFQQNSIRCA